MGANSLLKLVICFGMGQYFVIVFGKRNVVCEMGALALGRGCNVFVYQVLSNAHVFITRPSGFLPHPRNKVSLPWSIDWNITGHYSLVVTWLSTRASPPFHNGLIQLCCLIPIVDLSAKSNFSVHFLQSFCIVLSHSLSE